MKLLNRSIGLYIIYATILLLIVIPVLYFAIQQRVVEEVDESLVEQKHKTLSRLAQIDSVGLVPIFQGMEPGISLEPGTTPATATDRLYTIASYDSIIHENSPYRILETAISIRDKPYMLKIKSSLLDSQDLIEGIVKIVAVLLLLIISGMVLINRVIAKRLWKPFYDSVHQLKDFKIESNEKIEFEKTSISEFNDLNKAISELTSRNKTVFQSQKEFTENASHEMQTPLAVLQGKLDLLMQTNPLSQEQSELIAGIADVQQRMNRLNRTLLLLTKIENNQFADIETIDVKQLINKLTAQYGFIASQKGIVLKDDTNELLQMNANRMLVEVMLGNFLSNAIKHNNTGGSVLISNTERGIYFANTGNLTALPEEKIFERFQKMGADSTSLGLGLQIAKKIADYYQYRIEYSFHNNQHLFGILVQP